eukprot:9016232-Prorocentrum_lima.AAC.1
MTSSLVGSEMCIRDSFRCTEIPSTLQGPSEQNTTPIHCTTQVCMARAVSYTHLTLPTICSV